MCPWNCILQWKEIERFGYFWHGKLTLKVKNWQFLSSEFGTLARNMKMPCESFLISGQSCALDLMRNPKFESKKKSSHHVPHVFLNLGIFMGSALFLEKLELCLVVQFAQKFAKTGTLDFQIPHLWHSIYIRTVTS